MVATPSRVSTLTEALLRLVPLAACAILMVVVTQVADGAPRGTGITWLGALAAAGVAAVALAAHPVAGPAGRTAEVVITAAAAMVFSLDLHATASEIPIGYAVGAFLPYLSVPVLSSALRQRVSETRILLVVAAAALTAAAIVNHQLRDGGYLAVCLQWWALAGLAAVAAGQRGRSAAERRDQPQPYAEATRLLTQLRGVARQLPGATLDPGGIAEHLIEELSALAPVSRAAVLSTSGGGRLVVLAQSGAERVAWETALDTESAIADAWASQQPHTTNRAQSRPYDPPDTADERPEVSAMVVPLVAGVRTVGLVALETDTPGSYPPDLVSKVVAVATPAALRLEAALLFDEVRSIATTEERQRLAREIHDGVAQELVMVGYGIDNALAALPDAEAAAEDLRNLRAEVTRVITELRLSLFELRSEVDRAGGLTAAVAEFARTVAASAGLRVHMSIDESTARLPAAIEAELLRIAQEAITNARKHAGAENLWVTCTVDPPFAQVEVSDDGKGITDPHPGGRYGLTIMAERAERIRGRLEITPRVPNGTTVAVVLGTAPRRGSV